MAKALIINTFVITGHIAFLFLYKLEFAGEVELDMLKVLLRHIENVTGIGKEDIASVFVLCHILILTLLEIVEFLLIIALYPAGFMEMNRLPTALGIVLVLQAILDNLKLKLTHGTHDAATVELVDKQLSHTLVHELLQSLLELLALHWVIILDILEEKW